MLAHQAKDVIGTKCQVFLSFPQEVEEVFGRIFNTNFWGLSLVNVDVQVEEAEPPAIKNLSITGFLISIFRLGYQTMQIKFHVLSASCCRI